MFLGLDFALGRDVLLFIFVLKHNYEDDQTC